MSSIAQSLAVPVTAIGPDAVIVALPADCMRSPVLLLPVELAVLAMTASFAVKETPAKDVEGPVLFAALTALPPWLLTVTPGESVRLNVSDAPPLRLMLLV
jgi:hypothetical protein